MISVRRAVPSDAASIAAIHVRAWQEAYKGLMPDDFLASLSIEQRTTGWEKILLKHDTDVWVAEEEGCLLGWMTVAASRDADADVSTAELWAINVDPTAWRRGVGSALWKQALNYLGSSQGSSRCDADGNATAGPYSQITLWVLKDNARALRFYTTIGFSNDQGKQRTIEIAGASLTEVRLRRSLRL